MGVLVGYLLAVVGRDFWGQGVFYSRKAAWDAAVFVAIVALLVDVVFYASLAEEELAGGPLVVWSVLKVLGVAGAVGWLAYDRRDPATSLIAAIFVLVGLEDAIGITQPLGIWLVEESGIRRGPQGANSQLLRRVIVMMALLGPTIFMAGRAPAQLRRAIGILLAFLAAIFLAAVLGDLAADRTGTNLDELLEEPVLSLALGFAIGLIVDFWPDRRLRVPTRTPLRPRSR